MGGAPYIVIVYLNGVEVQIGHGTHAVIPDPAVAIELLSFARNEATAGAKADKINDALFDSNIYNSSAAVRAVRAAMDIAMDTLEVIVKDENADFASMKKQ